MLGARGQGLTGRWLRAGVCPSPASILPFALTLGNSFHVGRCLGKGEACHSLGAQQSAQCTAGSWCPGWGECHGPHLETVASQGHYRWP